LLDPSLGLLLAMHSLTFAAFVCSILSLSCVSAQSATGDCSYCYSHFSSCHQPTTAPDSQIYTQCYCDTSFIAMYSACVTDCGWSSAGIPALASITATCAGEGGTGETSGASAATATGSSSTGGTAETTTKTGTSTQTSKSSSATVALTSTASATSGLENKDLMYGLAFRLQGALLAGLVVVWIFGWL